MHTAEDGEIERIKNRKVKNHWDTSNTSTNSTNSTNRASMTSSNGSANLANSNTNNPSTTNKKPLHKPKHQTLPGCVRLQPYP